MALDSVKSQSILSLDATPIIPLTAGQGGVGRTVSVSDWCAATAAGLGSAGSYYKLVRFPTMAILQSVTIATDKAPDSATSVLLSLNFGIVASDAIIVGLFDGTPSWLAGQVPTTANTGGTTTISSPSSPNYLFGSVNPSSHTVGYGPTDLVFNGIGATYNFSGLVQQPLWQTFGFTNAVGNPADPGGYFDLYAYVATAASTGIACNIWGRVTYII
jgi:hypothetical protein